MNTMKLMTIGYSNVGKTYFLGSLFKLSYDVGSKGFSIQSKKFNETTDISSVFGIVSGVDQKGTVSTTVDIRSSSMVLKRGVNNLFDIEITDIEGQAIEPGRNLEVSNKILEKITEYDGLILILEAPQNDAECDINKQQLAQMLNFAGEALSRNEKIPITLVINKIDRLQQAKDINKLANEEVATLKVELMKKYPGNPRKVAQEMRFREGTVINRHVKNAINTFEIFEICENFFNFVRNTSLSVPCKVFPATSFGFGSGRIDNINSFLGENGLYKPYGGGACFLWTIYARLKSLSVEAFNEESVGTSLDNLTKDLLEDITEIYSRGKAYYDTDDNNGDNIFSLRNVSNLRSGVEG